MKVYSMFTVEYQPETFENHAKKIQACSFTFIFSLAINNILP